MSNIDLAITIIKLKEANNMITKLGHEASLMQTAHEALCIQHQNVKAQYKSLSIIVENTNEQRAAFSRLLKEAQAKVAMLEKENAALIKMHEINMAEALLMKAKPLRKSRKTKYPELKVL